MYDTPEDKSENYNMMGTNFAKVTSDMKGFFKDNLTPYRIAHILGWLCTDAVILLGAYIFSFWGRTITFDIFSTPNLSSIGIAVLITLFFLHALGNHHRIWAQSSGHNISSVVTAFMISAPLVIVISISRRPYLLPLSVIIMANLLASGTLVAVRYRSRLITGLTWRWNFIWYRELPDASQVRVLVVGANEQGQDFAWRLKHRWAPSHNDSYKLVGFIDEDRKKQGLYVEGCPVWGGQDEIPEIVRSQEVELIVLATANTDGQEFRNLLEICEQTEARIKIIPDTFAIMTETRDVPLLRDVEPEDLLGRAPISRHGDVDFSPIQDKVVLITGAAGSIGSELVRQIFDHNPSDVVLLDNNESGLHEIVTELRMFAYLWDIQYTPVLADITDTNVLEAIFEQYKPQVVFHAAAYKHVPILEEYPQQAIRVNVGGTWNLAQLSAKHEVERFVMVSTDKAVDPSSVMGASKRVGELLMQALNYQNDISTKFTAVRFGNVISSRGSVVPTFNLQIDRGGPVTVTHKEMARYFMTIPEAVNLVIHAACMTQGADLFMLRMGELVHISHLAERMIRMRGLRPHQDVEVKYTGVRPGEKLTEKLKYDSEELVPTQHPHIINLKTPNSDFSPKVFLSFVKNLIEWVPTSNETSAKLFLDVMLKATQITTKLEQQSNVEITLPTAVEDLVGEMSG